MKLVYIILGFIALILGIIGIVTPVLPTTPFLLLTLYFFSKSSQRLQNWFMQTEIYTKHLQPFYERRTMPLKTKVILLAFASTMLLLGFYFTSNMIARIIILTLIAVKYWFFLYWIETENE